MNHSTRCSLIAAPSNWLLVLSCFGLWAGLSCLFSEPANAEPVHLIVSANIDGSDRLIITRDEARWEHLSWNIPTKVKVNGIKWSLHQSFVLKNAGETKFLPQEVDFSTARVAARSGRDVVAMETQPDRIIIYFADCPLYDAPYSIDVVFNEERSPDGQPATVSKGPDTPAPIPPHFSPPPAASQPATD